MVLTATLVTVQSNGQLIINPQSQQFRVASSAHVLAFSSQGDLLVVESEGDFSVETWEDVYDKAYQICHGEKDDAIGSEDISMDSSDNVTLEGVLKDTVQKKVMEERRWKESLG